MLARDEWMMLLVPPVVYTCAFVPVCKYVLDHSKRATMIVHKMRHTHNVVMAVFSLYMTVLAVVELAQRPLTPHGLLCEPARPAPKMVSAWYYSKLLEWVDSALLLAQSKPLGSLHYNHHATTATVVASHFVGRSTSPLNRFDSRTSIFDVPLLLNAAVHTLMYSYYAAPQTLRPLRKLITSSQIMQHMTVLVSILYTSGTLYAGGQCDISPAANALSLGLYGMYLTQFLFFYARTYLSKGAKKGA